MNEKDIVFVVGNGLSMDLRQHFQDSLASWNTSSPLTWNLVHPECDRPLVDLFPRAFQVLHDDPSAASDFERMTRIVDRVRNLDDYSVVELRHYLAMAFSMYQRSVDSLPMAEWRWSRFIKSYAHRLGGIVSFNYDLVAERIATQAGVRLLTPQLPEHHLPLDSLRQHRVCLWKPHGSIDYRPSRNSVVVDVTYPLQNMIDHNDLPLEWCPEPEWTIPRVEADLVIPTETSRYRDFQWVRPGREWVQSEGRLWSACVLVGLSYAACDRDEVDVVLKSLPKHAVVYIVDPYPSQDLLDRVFELDLEAVCLQEPPEVPPRTNVSLVEIAT